jgi:hypothetical protein
VTIKLQNEEKNSLVLKKDLSDGEKQWQELVILTESLKEQLRQKNNVNAEEKVQFVSLKLKEEHE